MSGPIVRTGATPEFSNGWDRIFGDGKTTKKKATKKKTAKKAAAKKTATKKAAKKTAKKQPVKPVLKMKGSKEFQHDLYKLEVNTFKKNTSYKYGVVSVQPTEHVHYYHSINSQGKPLQYSSACGGHFHEIETYIDPDTGEMKAKCGPPLQYVTRTKGNDSVREIKKVRWVNTQQLDDDDRPTYVYDNHTHEVSYIETEFFTQEGQRLKAKEDANKMAMMSNG